MDFNKLIEIISEEVSNYDLSLQEAKPDDTLYRERNADLIISLLNFPDYGPVEYETMVLGYGYKGVLSELKKNDLDSPRKRNKFTQMMRNVGINTVSLILNLENREDYYQLYDSVAKIVFSSQFRERQNEGKAFLISLMLFGKWENQRDGKVLLLKEKIHNIARFGSYKICRDLAKRIVTTIGVFLGFEKKKSRTELVQIALEDLNSTQDIDDYRLTLMIVQRELSNLKEDVESEIRNRVDTFTIDFFATMNSAKNSYLLDTIDETLNQIVKKDSNINNDLYSCKNRLEIMTLIFKNLLKFYNIYPISQVNDIKSIESDKITDYEITNYTSSIEETLKEPHIKAKILSPGWKLKDLVIDKPKIEIL